MCRFLDLCNPCAYVPNIVDIDVHTLQSSGIDAIMLDLDNTMLPWQSTDVPESTRAWVEGARGLGMKLCIVSNTHNPKRLNKIAAELGVISIAHALKPRKRGFERAAELVGCEPSRSAVVGDQVLTDILGGNRAGMRTILVTPMHRREFIGTKLSRVIEACILAVLRGKGQLGTKSWPTQSEMQDTK